MKPYAGVGIARGTLYNWRVKYGGMDVSQLKELKALQEENRRLKQMYADLALDNKIPRDVIKKKTLEPEVKKEIASEIVEEYEVSITRACRLMEIDFVSDVVESGRKFRVMNVLDDADRTVVAQEISMYMPAHES